MKRFRLVDAAVLIALIAVAAGLAVRTWRPDAVSSVLTDLSRREPVTVYVALPNPWRQPPLEGLPRAGDSQVGEGGRDRVVYVAMTGETGYPVAVFHAWARVDARGRRWFNYGELLPGSTFSFRPGAYTMEGLILRLERGHAENAGASLVPPVASPPASVTPPMSVTRDADSPA